MRIAEDVDEQALSYAEIKALATGNPLIIEKCQLEMEVGKLKLIQSNYLSQRYDLEDKILKYYPAEIRLLTERIEGYTADIGTVREHTQSEGYSMVIEGQAFGPKDKKAAGTAILEACKAMTNAEPVVLGQYRGFDMSLSFDVFNREYRVVLKGALSHTVALGTDVYGNITRMDNALEGMEPKLLDCGEKLEALKAQMETAKAELLKPFPQEAELAEKSARLNEINIALNLDERDHELVDAVPDEGEEQPQRKPREGVR